MLHVQHLNCGTSAYAECLPGCDAVPGAHLAGCPAADLDALVTCPPGAGCCEIDHHHGQAANACTGDHEGPHHVDNPGCAVCRPLVITVLPGSVPVAPVSGG